MSTDVIVTIKQYKNILGVRPYRNISQSTISGGGIFDNLLVHKSTRHGLLTSACTLQEV